MKRHLLTSFVYGGSALALLLAATPASAVNLFNQDDTIRAIDSDPRLSRTPDHGNENSNKVVDQVYNDPAVLGVITTKYLNFGREGSGFIVTPTFGSSIIQSFQLRAANDSASRDPLTYTLYGSNDTIDSAPNSTGNDGTEQWFPISSGVTGLGTDPGRHNLGVIQDIANGAPYTSYKMIFHSIRDRDANDADSMQVADVQLFTEQGGMGSAVLSGADGPFTIAIADGSDSLSRIPGANEAPSKAFDGDNNSKYLNFAKENSGVIVSRADGKPTIVESLQLVTGGDAPARDPLTFALYGTNDPLVSVNHSRGNLEDWIWIASGDTGISHLIPDDPSIPNVPLNRNQAGDIILVDNSTAYSAYRLVFPTLRDGAGANSMQVSEIILSGQVVPEPSTFVMVGLAVTAFGVVARRRNTRSA